MFPSVMLSRSSALKLQTIPLSVIASSAAAGSYTILPQVKAVKEVIEDELTLSVIVAGKTDMKLNLITLSFSKRMFVIGFPVNVPFLRVEAGVVSSVKLVFPVAPGNGARFVSASDSTPDAGRTK